VSWRCGCECSTCEVYCGACKYRCRAVWEQLCILCNGTGIDEANSYPAEGPSYYSMGEPAVLEPCICQFVYDTTEFHEAEYDELGYCIRCD
jgi:hypothetical protein